MQEKLTAQFPSQGWRQILTGRKEILDAYDRAREQARAHEVETYHGKVLEGAFRKWLQEFLPKRYDVASGYVVSAGHKSSVKAPHFDVIIYDRLESPVLWVEDNPDASSLGRSLAIPVEYVRAVLEVKSRFSSTTVKDAIDHLGDLSDVMKAFDDPHARYKFHLPTNFFCGFLCAELRNDKMYSDAALDAVTAGVDLRNFFGGVVLRTEENANNATGRIQIYQSPTPLDGSAKEYSSSTGGRRPSLTQGLYMSKSRSISEEVHVGSFTMWTEAAFAQFAFDVVAMLQGTYEIGRLSSFYGLGSSLSD